jgi:UDP-glucose 4-epimerase
VLVRRLLSGELGSPARIIVFSRDEAKQHYMRLAFMNRTISTDEIVYRLSKEILEFRIGDVRNYDSVASAVKESDIVFNAAALKQVPTCEYFPLEAVMTNTIGPSNITRAIDLLSIPIETVVGISTDKACKPVNVMGMTKALQERIIVQANMRSPGTRFICVRYGNVLASRGSVIPLFHDQIRHGGPLTITHPDMTRFLLSLEQAVDTIFAAMRGAKRGETYVPRVAAARVVDIAKALIGKRKIGLKDIGVYPGEKLHEILVSEAECLRTVERDGFYVILPLLPELSSPGKHVFPLKKEFSSRDNVLGHKKLVDLLHAHKCMIEDTEDGKGEFLR